MALARIDGLMGKATRAAEEEDLDLALIFSFRAAAAALESARRLPEAECGPLLDRARDALVRAELLGARPPSAILAEGSGYAPASLFDSTTDAANWRDVRAGPKKATPPFPRPPSSHR